MTKQNPMAEDTFEKAREAFFGTAKISTEQTIESAKFLNPRDEPTSKEVIGPFSGEHEAT